MKPALLPRPDTRNGWSAILPARTPRAPLSASTKADWLIIGAGYAGLAAARQLASTRPDDTIVVLEAGIVGENASGRNSGFAIDVPHNVGSSLDELRQAEHYGRLLRAGMETLESLIAEFGIDCHWSRKGKYHCAATASVSAKVLDHYARALEAMGRPYEFLKRDQLEARLGTAFFHSGVYSPGDALLNPAALVRGLADNLPANVHLCENSAVLEMTWGQPHVARTGSGSVSAGTVLLANSIFAPRFGAFKDRQFAAASYGSLSKPLDAAQQRRMGNVEEWGVTPASGVAGATMRYTHDHRILIRQQIDYAPQVDVGHAQRTRIQRQHRAVFDRRFPQLKDVELEHFWDGHISITANGAPAWGMVAPDVYATSGCNGVGIVKQTIAGMLLADLAAGVDNPLIADMRALGAPSRLPPRPLLDIGVGLRLASERWMGRKELG